MSLKIDEENYFVFTLNKPTEEEEEIFKKALVKMKNARDKIVEAYEKELTDAVKQLFEMAFGVGCDIEEKAREGWRVNSIPEEEWGENTYSISQVLYLEKGEPMKNHIDAIEKRTQIARDEIKHKQDLQSRLIDSHLQEVMRHLNLAQAILERGELK